MEIFYIMLGFVMIYFWVHALVILFKNVKVKGYDQVVLIVALTALILFILGSLI